MGCCLLTTGSPFWALVGGWAALRSRHDLKRPSETASILPLSLVLFLLFYLLFSLCLLCCGLCAAVHYLSFPEPRMDVVDPQAEQMVARMQTVVELVRNMRDAKNVSLKVLFCTFLCLFL